MDHMTKHQAAGKSAQTNKQHWWFSYVGLLVLSVLLITGSGLIRQLPAWRLDLTEDKLYTLSQGTQQLIRSLEQPVTLTFFFSNKATKEIPQLRDYARRVRDLLNEYALISEGKITLQVVDPEPFSEAEDRAAQLGLQGIPARAGGDVVYFGLAVELSDNMPPGQTGSIDQPVTVSAATPTRQQIINFFNPQRESFLEYDISQTLYKIAQTRPRVVGVLSTLNVFGENRMQGQAAAPWMIIDQLKQLAEIRPLNTAMEQIPSEVNLLMVIQPQSLSLQSLYAIDQFVLRGGKALIFVDPLAEMAAPVYENADTAAQKKQVEKLLAAWGVVFDTSQVVADAGWALQLASRDDGIPMPHLGVLGLRFDAINDSDIVTQGLESVNISTAGLLTQVSSQASLPDWTPLLFSSEQAMLMSREQFVGLTDHAALLDQFKPAGERYVLAARIQGHIQSAFAEGSPVQNEAAAETGPTNHLTASVHAANLIIVADTDLLSDRLWVQVSDFFGQRVAAPWANNGDFVMNMVENLSGSADLIDIRSRGIYTRPFIRVEQLQQNAATKFQAQEQSLIHSLEKLEAKILQLSQNEQGQIIVELNPQQQKEVAAFEKEKLQIRKDLRQVQHQLNKDIESLESTIKFINMVIIPGLLTLAVMLLVWRRNKRCIR